MFLRKLDIFFKLLVKIDFLINIDYLCLGMLSEFPAGLRTYNILLELSYIICIIDESYEIYYKLFLF